MVVPDRTEEERRLADVAKLDSALHALRAENDAITREALIAERVPGEDRITAIVEQRLGNKVAEGAVSRRSLGLRLLTAAVAVAAATLLVVRLRSADGADDATLTPAGVSDVAFDATIVLDAPTSRAGAADGLFWSLSDDDRPGWTYILVVTDRNSGEVVRMPSKAPTRTYAEIPDTSRIWQWRSWSCRIECRTELGVLRKSPVVVLE